MAIVVILPQGSWITWRIRWMLDYTGCKKKVVAWHYAQLKKLEGVDFVERFTRLAALEKARKEEGIGIILGGTSVARIKG